eukprot:5988811-Pleurochrysis_carterae.AAC.1
MSTHYSDARARSSECAFCLVVATPASSAHYKSESYLKEVTLRGKKCQQLTLEPSSKTSSHVAISTKNVKYQAFFDACSLARSRYSAQSV